jgi:histone acetyltransferase (RNA polymerase elongator complex component)
VGISSLDDGILKACARGYTAEEALGAIERLLREDLHAGAQLMIGLPGQDPESTLRDLRRLARLKGPRSMDLRIYPCLVLKGTSLESLWKSGRYTPLQTEEAARWAGLLMAEALDLGFEILRVGLAETDSLSSSVAAGPHHPAFGELAWGECLALLLIRNSACGPWAADRKKQSLLLGHRKRGIRRLAELSGQTLPETLRRLTFWPPAKRTRKRPCRSACCLT